MATIAVVHIPHFPIAVARRDTPSLAEQPLVLVTQRSGQMVVVAASDPAVTPGLALRRARLLCPDAAVQPHEPARDHEVLLALRATLDTISPRVALLTALPDVALAVDLGRLEVVRAAQLAPPLVARIMRQTGLTPAIGAAATQTVAHLAAKVAEVGAAVTVPDGSESSWLAPHPVEWLPIEPALVARLHQFGLRTIGALARLPCDALEAQFGSAGGRLFALAHGRDPLPLSAPAAPPPLVMGRRFSGPVADTQMLDTALAQLAARLASHLLRHGQAARHLTLKLTLEHHPPIEAHRTLAEPTADPARLHALLATLLRDQTLASPCEQLTVAVEPASLTVAQGDLFAPETANAEQLERALARLSIKHGSRLLRATLADPHARCLERRVRIAPREEA
jgi:DNA polymerase IV